jgi:hypothetical protein
MEDGDLPNRVEGVATWLVDQHSLVGDRRHHTVVDEVTDDLPRRRLVNVRRRHLGRIPVLCEKFGFESFVIVSSLVEYIWISHETSREARLLNAPRGFCRQ